MLAADTGVYLGHTYRVVVPSTLTSWTAAQAAAQAAGGHLVTINSAGEQAFVEGLLASADAPTGAYDIGGRVTSTAPLAFGWTTGEPFSYRHWYSGEPNSAFRAPGSEPVMAMLWTRTAAEPTFSRRGFWNDQVERGYGPGESIFADVNQAGYVIETDTAEGVYEAENASITGAVVDASHPGFSGSGFVDYQHAGGDAVEFTVNVASAGRYALDFRYANGSGADRLTGLSVNGLAVANGLSFARTGSWRTWGEVTATVPLVAGVNRVRVVATGQSGPNLDSLTVRAVEPPAVIYQAESATLSGPLALSNHAGFTGTGFADYQHASGDFIEFVVEAPAAGRYVLDFRYANGGFTDRPKELKVNGAAVPGGVSFAPTGSWSTWSVERAAVSLPAGASRVRLTATGRSGPNLDSLTVQAAGDVAYLAQRREVFGSLSEHYDIRDPDTGMELDGAAAFEERRRAAPDFGDFDAAVEVRVTPPPGAFPRSGVVLATQRSSLTDRGITVAGDVDGATWTEEGTYTVASDADVTFELARPRDYVLTYAVPFKFAANTRARMDLSAAGGAEVFDVSPPTNVDDGPQRGTLTGRLAPGRYRFVFHYEAGSDVGVGGDYSVGLALNP